ncbi:presenilins-associated rhomboid-like protein, mitochondrial [Fukomys damarensis]|uniref:presenilins-associated rhomboid-like protein, mitochondrial n=1 Tax=Fukomys damarensis TaxID=885580 RepID=UPI0014555E9B|nr:presenilins-associated rhomboid-like protein, mitochondrial [Fukomys damarensis]
MCTISLHLKAFFCPEKLSCTTQLCDWTKQLEEILGLLVCKSRGGTPVRGCYSGGWVPRWASGSCARGNNGTEKQLCVIRFKGRSCAPSKQPRAGRKESGTNRKTALAGLQDLKCAPGLGRLLLGFQSATDRAGRLHCLMPRMCPADSRLLCMMSQELQSVHPTVNEKWLHLLKISRRFNFFIQQKCGFRKAPRKIEPRRSDTGPSGGAYKRSALIPPVEETVFDPSPYPIRTLIKPFFFTVGFTGCAFGSAAIWQYESLKSRVQSYFDGVKADWLDSISPQKKGDLRKEINKWWNNLSDGQRTVTGIITANVLVFCLWRVPALQRTMIRYFTSNPASKVLCSPMLLSSFSHFSLFHMAANMYVLWSFSSSVVSILGQEQFLAVYLSAGVISNFVSYVCKVATGRYGPSLGASGAIMTVLAAVCTKKKLFEVLLTCPVGGAIKCHLQSGDGRAARVSPWEQQRGINSAHHPAVPGWYVIYGHELIWKNREPLVKMWHELRTRGPRKGGGSE